MYIKRSKIGFVLTVGILFLMVVSFKEAGIVTLQYPKSWPKPAYPFAKKPLQSATILLGRKLFYETALSANNTVSCGSCHLSYTAFTHVDHALSHGIYDSIGTRNSPVLINLAWSKSFMWDGRVEDIDIQAVAPITHPSEMGENLEQVVAKLQKIQPYPALFYAGFGDSMITGQRLLKAIAQFELTLVSANSKYDQVMRHEPGIEFTELEANGLKLFNRHCNQCHKAPLFTTGEFANNGLLPNKRRDAGRADFTGRSSDSFKFKIPTLRNIEFSFPYMHDGRFRKLSDVLNHYSTGIHHSSTLAPELKNGIELSSNEKVDLIAFLLTLSDKEFLFNPGFAYPRE